MRQIGAHVSTSGGLSNAIDNTLKIGGNCLQIFAGSPRMWFRKPFPDSDVHKYLKGIQENNIGNTFIHALYLVNLATDNLDLFEKSILSLVADLQNGLQIKSAGVIVHIGSHQGRGFDVVKDQLVAVLERILDETTDTNLILENDAGQNGKIGSVEELSYLISKINDPRLKVCLDTAHLFESGIDISSVTITKKFMANLKELNLIDKVVCIHLNDSSTDLDSHRDMHANLGEGKIGLDGLRQFVNQPEFVNLPLILEVPGENKQGPNLENISIAKSL
jgi:deoxyribonuclease-4